MANVDTHHDDWEKDAPILSSLKGQQPHEAPEGYFDSFPGSLMDRIREMEANEAPGDAAPSDEGASPGRSWRLGPRSYSIAAVVAILAAVGIYFMTRTVDVPVEPVVGEVVVAEDVDAPLFDEEELFDQLDISALPDEEIEELMGDEALASWEIDQLGQALDIELNDLDMEDLEGLDDLDDLDDFDLEGLDDLLF